MQETPILMTVVAVIVSIACVLVAGILALRRRILGLAREFLDRAGELHERVVIEPQSCVYRGAEKEFGNIKGNGVLCLTEKRLMFKKLTGQRIEIERLGIAGAAVTSGFRGETDYATGGSHLVVHTSDGNTIGFLVKNATRWIEELRGN